MMVKLTNASPVKQSSPSSSPKHHYRGGHHQQPQPATTPLTSRPLSPQPPPFPGNGNGNDEAHLQEVEDDERAALINEIRRLERSMNEALRGSRDEIESLQKSSVEKRAELTEIEEELECIRSSTMVGDQQCNGGGSGWRRSINVGSSVSNGNGGSDPLNLRSKLLSQNSRLLRRVTVSAVDRPFFRRPTMLREDAPEELSLSGRSESFRRRSDPFRPDDDDAARLSQSENYRTRGSFLRRRQTSAHNASCDDSLSESRQSSKGSRGSRSVGKQNQFMTAMNSSLNSLSLPPCSSGDDSGSDDGASDSQDDDAGREEMMHYETTLESKKQQLAQLRDEHLSNSTQLSYLQSKLESIRTRSRSRWEEHASVIEGLESRKQSLVVSVERRERSLAEAMESGEAEERLIAQLEKEIESRTSGDRRNGADAVSKDGVKFATASDLEEEIRRYQLRQKIHSRYTAKALESFSKSVDAAKRNDDWGMLFQTEHTGQEDAERRRRLVEGISLDADIQLNNLERMIREVEEKVEEYELLTSAGSYRVVAAMAGGDTDDPCQEHGNQLLSLSKECADLLADLLSTVSKAMESTIRTSPRSLSIEFQPTSPPPDESGAKSDVPITTCSNDDEDDDILPPKAEEGGGDGGELPYFQIQRRKMKLREIQRAQLRVDGHISLLQNDIRCFQRGVQDEMRAHHEMMSHLQTKLRILVERLEEGGEEASGLADEAEGWEERDEVLR